MEDSKQLIWCSYTEAYILDRYIRNGPAWQEITEYYDPREDMYFTISVDQDGGEEMYDEHQGEKSQSKLWRILNE